MVSDREWGASFAKATTNAMNFYDEIMVPRLFEPWALLLLDALSVESGQTVLDVACGPGTVTRLAARRVGPVGSVTGCDLSRSMLDLARAKPRIDGGAPIHYVECPADKLGATDRSIDVVTCQQGLQFFPDRPAALAEMRRVLRPGGNVGVAVWCDVEDNPPFLALASALEAVLGADVANTYKGGPWGFGDSSALVALANDAGFTDVNVKRHELPVVFEGGPGQLLLTLHASAVAPQLAQFSEADQSAFATAVADATRHLNVDGAIHSYASSHILMAKVSED
jgi:ubiquinone/menaquinone biosynthesis C-methylase UbiE